MNRAATAISPLLLRLILAYEFWEAGLAKWHGENWFGTIKLPFPVNFLPVELNWYLAMGTEIIGAVLLLLGLGTRLASAALIFIMYVAIASVHWPEHISSFGDLLKGYVITNEGFGNFRLPLIFAGLLTCLLLSGGGRWSLDSLLCRKFNCPQDE